MENNLALPCFDSATNTARLGLTKREYFAAMAMQGLLSHSDFDYCPLTYESVGKIVNDSFCLAEAMVKASHVQS